MTKGIQTQVVGKKVEKVKIVKEDSAEIDDLFNVLSKSKKSKTTISESSVTSAVTPTPTSKPSKSKCSDQEQNEYSDVFESATEDENDSTETIKGIPYDPTRDDFIPSLQAASITTTTPSDDFFDSRGLKRKTRALTEDGLPIFTPKELKIGLGGGTDLCPFDCNCCF